MFLLWTEPVSFTVQGVRPFPLLLCPHRSPGLPSPLGRALSWDTAGCSYALSSGKVSEAEWEYCWQQHFVVYGDFWCLHYSIKSGNWGPERQSDLPKKLLLVSGKAETRTQIFPIHASPPHSKSHSIELLVLRSPQLFNLSTCSTKPSVTQSWKSTCHVPSSVPGTVEQCGLFVECESLFVQSLCRVCLYSQAINPGESIIYVCVFHCCRPGTGHTPVIWEYRSDWRRGHSPWSQGTPALKGSLNWWSEKPPNIQTLYF